MWVFGYGSLMWDGWEEAFGCRAKLNATLGQYRRVFNKASIRNWGTRERPGPTLNLEERREATCVGTAFEFDDQCSAQVQEFLRKREGGFAFDRWDVSLSDEREVTAIVPIYRGPHLIKGATTAELAAMAAQATGTDGTCRDYIINVAAKLSELGIEDREVIEMRAQLTAGV